MTPIDVYLLSTTSCVYACLLLTGTSRLLLIYVYSCAICLPYHLQVPPIYFINMYHLSVISFHPEKNRLSQRRAHQVKDRTNLSKVLWLLEANLEF